MTVKFYENVEDSLLKYAVIVSVFHGKRVFCKHRSRDTFECPGGRREAGEAIDETAKRELWEETGAERFTLTRIAAYSVSEDGEREGSASEVGRKERGAETFGALYFAEIDSFGALPPLEIERIAFFETLPERWTYPDIQPALLRKAEAEVKFAGTEH